jgi:major membrane immunogen (membrane-anchored lipoprotein)
MPPVMDVVSGNTAGVCTFKTFPAMQLVENAAKASANTSFFMIIPCSQ